MLQVVKQLWARICKRENNRARLLEQGFINIAEADERVSQMMAERAKFLNDLPKEARHKHVLKEMYNLRRNQELGDLNKTAGE
jgi:hypothetical protein